MKKVLVITSSLRRGSNSDALAESFARGARDAGNQVEAVSLKDKHIGYCIGCLACQKTGRCVLKDDAAGIVEKAKEADVLVFASPVYYYSVSGQLKTMLDRLNPLYAVDCRFTDVYLLSVAHEDARSAVEGSVTAVQGWVDCFPKARLAGTIFAGGVGAPGEIQGHPALDEAYKAGNSL